MEAWLFLFTFIFIFNFALLLARTHSTCLPPAQAVLRLNGEYWGKVAVGEDWHARALAAAGFAASQDAVADGGGALLWKSQSGENANLRWDLPQDQVQYAWQLDEGGPQGEAERALLDLSRGVAGGDSKLNREEFLFDNVDLPRTINNLAAQAVLLNQDRCALRSRLISRDALIISFLYLCLPRSLYFLLSS